MEQKPHKKEDLILANNVVRLAQDLLKVSLLLLFFLNHGLFIGICSFCGF